jgi:hypothetical protein
MKLGFRYNGNYDSEPQVFDAETGKKIERVTAVSFFMKAGDAMPTMCIQCLPSVIEIDGAEATEVTQADMEMFVTRSRSIDLDGVDQNEQ